MKTTRQESFFAALLVSVLALSASSNALGADEKPNMLVIWGDDIGRDNISAYNLGIMGDKTLTFRSLHRVSEERSDIRKLMKHIVTE
ncbi:hypothetical protein Q31b_13290 [Novipirellula aureliae]|uniref:Arylsulfatase n=1 Tax=Novipirellula aureliae TaxID=2527966 RepID=A0A5C6E780_9BACT|nr:hypothetical protein [Novipirellula aureliae]TWU43797.1 hypothetical protein Q31b_13290 [Novipirellula aureliae]